MKNLSKHLWVILLLVMAMTIAACGGDDDGNDNGGDAADTNEEAASGEVNLSQSITGESPLGDVTISYPEGWAAEVDEFGTITLAESTETLALADEPDAAPTDGQILGSVLQVFDAEMLGTMGLTDTATPTDVANAMVGGLAGGDTEGGPTFDAPVTFTANGKEGALISGAFTEGENTYDTIVVVIDEGDGMAVLVFATADGGTEQYNDEIQAIAGSIDYTPPAATEG